MLGDQDPKDTILALACWSKQLAWWSMPRMGYKAHWRIDLSTRARLVALKASHPCIKTISKA